VRWPHVLGPFLLISLPGCYTIVVDDITVMEDDYGKSREAVLAHATNEMACPREELTTRLLSVTVHADVASMEVTGCGAKRVYRRTAEGFSAK